MSRDIDDSLKQLTPRNSNLDDCLYEVRDSGDTYVVQVSALRVACLPVCTLWLASEDCGN